MSEALDLWLALRLEDGRGGGEQVLGELALSLEQLLREPEARPDELLRHRLFGDVAGRATL